MAGVLRGIIRFGPFEVDVERGELRKQGLRVRIQVQPFQVLAALLEHPGEVVTREELVRRLWPDGTIVDFDRGVNAAVTRLRQALSDSAEVPRYVETVARRGYRFLGSVEAIVPAPHPDTPPPPPEPAAPAEEPSARLRLCLAALATLLLAGAGTWWLFGRGREPAIEAGVKVAPLTGAAGSERHPGFSPGSTQVVYEWDRGDGNPHLYIKVVGPGDPVQLTSGAGAEYGPAWSPDGKWIAFLGAPTPSEFGLFVVAPIGGTQRKVIDLPPLNFGVLRRPYRRLDWTRDSSHVIVSATRPGAGDSLLLVSTETRQTAWLTATVGASMPGDRDPAVSPDGSSVVFARGNPGSETLQILPLTADLRPAGDPRPIVAAGPARSAAWLPDGRQLIFTSLNAGGALGFALSRVDLASGRPPRILPELGTHAATPVVSPQGRLAYSTSITEGHIWRQDIPASGQSPPPPVNVSSAAAIQLNARYSPDGMRVAFASERSGTREIWNCGADGGPCIQVTSFGCECNTDVPRWAPDGRHLVFSSRVAGQEDVYMVDANGGPPQRLTADGPHGSFPYWSRDGQWIYFATEVDRQIWKIPWQGGKAVPVHREGGGLIEETPDSKALYYVRRGDLYQAAPGDSGPKLLVKNLAYWGYAVAKDRIYYLHEPSVGKVEIRQRLTGGEDSRLLAIDKQLTGGLNLSPDGRSLLYSELRQRASVMLAEKLY